MVELFGSWKKYGLNNKTLVTKIMSNQLARLLFKGLKAYGISIPYHTIERVINTHPAYPSMQCISDALDSWKVKHIVLKLSFEELRALNVPVIAHLKQGEFVWVTQITDSKVHYWSVADKRKIESHSRFEEKWSGVALAIENIDEAGDPDYREERSKEIKDKIVKYGISGGCMVSIILLNFFSWLNDSILSLLPKIMLVCVNLAGCYISYTLIRQEKQQSNRLIRRFCVAGTHIDCDQVTKSRYSKLFGLVSWAEVGMAYFSAVVIWLAIAPVSADWLSPLWWFLLLPLPFTVWSLLTQAFLIRKWCLFCCAIVCLLWINAGIVYFFLPFVHFLPIVESALLALLIMVCTAAVLYVCRTNKLKDPYAGQREMAQIKYDLKTIKSQLSESQHETNQIGFVWGNPQASAEIALYVSIACSFCDLAVKELRRLTEIFPAMRFRILFNIMTDKHDDKPNTVVSHFTSLYKTMDKNEFFNMLDSWYAMPEKTLDALQKAFPVVSASQDNTADINALFQFSQQAKIGYTPAILFDGRLLSPFYSYRDLYGIARALNAES